MRRQKFILIAILLCAPAAFALNNRSAVAVTGLDTNPCTPASPCRSFGAAMAATAPGGEIVALSSAGYGPFTVPMDVTISGAPGIHAAITVTSGDGILVAPGTFSDRVILRNLVITGSGATNGIHQTSGAALTITGCLIKGFVNGIFSSDVDGHLVVDHCTVFDSDQGINVDGGTNPSAATITNCDVVRCAIAVLIGYHTNAAIVNSTLSYGDSGIIALDIDTLLGGSATRVIVENCTIQNFSFGVVADASGPNNTAQIALSQNVLAYNDTAILQNLAGTVVSYGNNRYSGNNSDGPVLGPISLQ